MSDSDFAPAVRMLLRLEKSIQKLCRLLWNRVLFIIKTVGNCNFTFLFAIFTITTYDLQYWNVRFYYINQLEMSLTKSPQYFAQYYYITLLFCILRLYYPFWALQRRPCHCFTETVVPRSELIIKTHQQGPFTMAIISSPSSRTTSHPSYGIKNGTWRTNISSGHNYVWWYFVSLTIEPPCKMMCFGCLHACSDSIAHQNLYYSARRPRDF
jgi:hypothetical protein